MRIKISDIKINPGRREAEPKAVEELAKSISAVGLMNPVTLDNRCGGNGEDGCEDGCRQYGGAAFFHVSHTFPPVFRIYVAFATNTISKDWSKVERELQSKSGERQR